MATNYHKQNDHAEINFSPSKLYLKVKLKVRVLSLDPKLALTTSQSKGIHVADFDKNHIMGYISMLRCRT